MLFNATLTVYNSAGFEHTSTVPIHVNNTAPRVRITSPLESHALSARSGQPDLRADRRRFRRRDGERRAHLFVGHEPASRRASSRRTRRSESLDHHGHHAARSRQRSARRRLGLLLRNPSHCHRSAGSLDHRRRCGCCRMIGTLPVTTVADSATVNRGGGAWIAVLANDHGGGDGCEFREHPDRQRARARHGDARSADRLDSLFEQRRFLRNRLVHLSRDDHRPEPCRRSPA